MTTVIAGYIAFDGPPADDAVVHRMLDAINPLNNPMARDVWSEGPVAIGVMSVAPRGSRPPVCPRVLLEEGLAIVADARLYQDTADAPERALVSAVKTHGAKAVSALHGDMAIAAWDSARAEVLLLRDHVGVRPLHYTLERGCHAAFASHPAALLTAGLASRNLDRQGVSEHVALGTALDERTLYRDIRSVRAAHAVTLSRDGQARTQRVWRLAIPPLMTMSRDRDEVAAEFRRLLVQAVHRRMPRSGPAFSHLSAGLDSTSIAVIAARAAAERGEDLHAYSILEEEERYGLDVMRERPFVEATAAQEPNIRLHEVSICLDPDLANGLDDATGLMFDPRDTEEQIARDVAQRGCEVLLSGWVGDEVVSARTRNWGVTELFWSGQTRAALRRLGEMQRATGRSKLHLFLSQIVRRPLMQIGLARRGGQDTEAFPGYAFLRCDLRHLARPAAHLAHFDGRLVRRSWLEHWWIEKTLERFAHRGMRHGYAYAFPMADLDLMAFAQSLPLAMLWEGGPIRTLFRSALTGIAPEIVRAETVKEIHTPSLFLAACRTRAATLDRIAGLERSTQVSAFVDIDHLRSYVEALPDAAEAIDIFRRHWQDGTRDVMGRHYWEPMILAEFLRRHEAISTDARSAD